MSQIRIAVIQTKRRTIPYKTPYEKAVAHLHSNLDALTDLATRAADQGCDIVAFPEDTLGTLEWEAGHWDEMAEFLRTAEREMLNRFGTLASSKRISIICCNDCADDQNIYNTAILIGREGHEIGRYHKVQLPLSEQSRTRGQTFPVFEIPEIGTIGMAICYDMMFPETTRILALSGADIVFHLTMGGASMASKDASLAAFKTRAADNFLYLAVAFRGGGSMIINPKGEIIAEAGGKHDAIITADIDLNTGRDAGDALGGVTTDFRARLFRERVPEAYGMLTEPHPPILEKLKHIHVPSPEEASRLMAEGLTTGADAFYEAERWLSEGNIESAKQRFKELADHFGTLWIGRASRERLLTIQQQE